MSEVWNSHSDDIGNWCSWSGEVVEDGHRDEGVDAGEQWCPAGCRGSMIEDGE